MGFVYHQKPLFIGLGIIIKERIRCITWTSLFKIPGVIFNTVDVSHFADHFQIVGHPLFNPKRLDNLSLFSKCFHLRLHIALYLLKYFFVGGRIRHKVFCRIDNKRIGFCQKGKVRFCPFFHRNKMRFVKFQTDDSIRICQKNINGVTTYPKCSTLTFPIIPGILECYQTIDNCRLGEFHPNSSLQDELTVLTR